MITFLLQEAYDGILAVWVFVHPLAVPKVEEWLATNKLPPLSKKLLQPLTEEQIADLTAFCGIDPQTNQQYVNQVNQKAGDIVKPRPGQLHYVRQHTAMHQGCF